MITITEKRVVYQEWYETEYTKTGWDSHGWCFDDGTQASGWDIIEHVQSDKHYNPTIGIAERKIEIG